jgi:hypothetical protein
MVGLRQCEDGGDAGWRRFFCGGGPRQRLHAASARDSALFLLISNRYLLVTCVLKSCIRGRCLGRRLRWSPPSASKGTPGRAQPTSAAVTMPTFAIALVAFAAAFAFSPCLATSAHYDVLVYGSTPGGIQVPFTSCNCNS